MKQAEVAAAATRETGDEYDLPLSVGDTLESQVPAPSPETADVERDQRLYPHDDDCCPNDPHPRP
jgi:hypothetical protein